MLRRLHPLWTILMAILPACAAEPPHEHGAHDHGAFVHRFQKAEEWAKQFDDPARDAWQHPAAVVAAMGIESGMTVADVGAGTGYFLPYLSRAVGPKGKVLALDIEPDMVRYMHERAAREGLANVDARVVAADDPGLPPGSVDRVLVVDTWHHVAGRETYAAKLRAGLAPRGAVYVVDFRLEATHGPPPDHRLGSDQVMRELAAGGLEAAVVDADLPDQYIVVGRGK